MKWKTTFVTVSFIMMWDSWPACERLGMCCVEEGPFPLNHMPLKIHWPPSNSPKRALKHTRPFCQRSRCSLHPTLPSPAQHHASPHKHPQITDTSCAGEYNARAGAAQLASLPTWHWLDLWHVTHPPRKPRSSPLQTDSVCFSISSPHMPGSEAGHTPSDGDILRPLRSIKFKLRINDF